MFIDDGFNKYTTHRGLLAYYYEKYDQRPLYDDQQKWALSLLIEWDEFTDYKRFEYLTKVIEMEKNTKDQIINILEACKAQLNVYKRDFEGEQFIAENKEDLDTEQVHQLEQFIMKEFKEGVKQYELNKEFSFQDKSQSESVGEIQDKIEKLKEWNIEKLKEEKVQNESEEENDDQDVKELKRQAKQKVTANTKKRQYQTKGNKRRNNTKNQKQNNIKPESQQNNQQFKQKSDQLIVKKKIDYEQYINHYEKQVDINQEIKKSQVIQDND